MNAQRILAILNYAKDSAPTNFDVLHNYPKPFNMSIKISFKTTEIKSYLSVLRKIYVMLGTEISILVNKENPPEMCDVLFNTLILSSVFSY